MKKPIWGFRRPAFKPINLQPMLAIPDERRGQTSVVLLSAIDGISGDFTLRQLVNRLGDRTFGVLLIVLAAFNVIPFISLFSGVLVSILGIQMLIGMERIWLPNFILDRPLPEKQVKSVLILFSDKVKRFERYIKPRWHFTEAPIVDRFNGFTIFILGILVALPIPFFNLAPALIIIGMGVGLLERDGLVQMISMLFSSVIITLMFIYF